MGVKLEENRKNNFDKIRIGSCIELLFLLDNFESDFSRLQNFIEKTLVFSIIKHKVPFQNNFKILWKF